MDDTPNSPPAPDQGSERLYVITRGELDQLLEETFSTLRRGRLLKSGRRASSTNQRQKKLCEILEFLHAQGATSPETRVDINTVFENVYGTGGSWTGLDRALRRIKATLNERSKHQRLMVELRESSTTVDGKSERSFWIQGVEHPGRPRPEHTLADTLQRIKNYDKSIAESFNRFIPTVVTLTIFSIVAYSYIDNWLLPNHSPQDKIEYGIWASAVILISCIALCIARLVRKWRAFAIKIATSLRSLGSRDVRELDDIVGKLDWNSTLFIAFVRYAIEREITNRAVHK